MGHARHAARGFTLLEVMVVMLIVAVLAAIAVPNLFAGKSRGKDLEREAAMLSFRLLAAQDDAMLYGEEYGLVFSDDGYRFVRWNAAAFRFEALPPARAWGQRAFEDAVTVSAAADAGDPVLVWPAKPEGNEDTASAPDWQPSVYVLSSGEVTPFSAVFSAEGSDETLELRIDPLGNRVLPPAPEGAAPAQKDIAHAG